MPASAQQSEAGQAEKSQRVKRWTIAVGVVLAVAVFLGLVSGLLPGIPDPQQKALTVFYRPNAGKEGLSLYLQPPMSMLQVEGRSQALAMQFTNYQSTPVQLLDVHVEPSNCFTLRFNRPGPLTVMPNQSVVLLPRLAARAGVEEDSTRCHQQSLNFVYSWDGAESRVNTNSVSTSPVTLIARWKEFAERLLHALDAIVISVSLPLFLGLLNYLYQRSADRRAQQETALARNLQVWKEILPSIIKLVTQHYVPISRKMDIVTEEIVKLESHDPAQGGSTLNVLAALLLLRRAVWELYQQNGGWYLRSKRAEQLCTNLADRLWDECDSYCRTVEFRNLAEGFTREDTFFTIRDHLSSPTVTPERRQLRNDFEYALRDPRKLDRIKRLLSLSTRVLDFECDRPLYPEWYEEAPRFNTHQFSVLGLGIRDEERVQQIAAEYMAGIRPECKYEAPA